MEEIPDKSFLGLNDGLWHITITNEIRLTSFM